MADDRENRLVTAGLAALMAAVAALGWRFIHAPPLLDDIEEFTHVAALAPPWRVLGLDCYGLFRPVKNLIFLAFQFWAPGRPEVWHATAILLYIGAVWLVFRLMHRLLGTRAWALCATAAWALSPTQVSALAWTSCVNIIVMTAAAVASLLACDTARDPSHARAGRRTVLLIVLSQASYFIALVSYESAVALPLLVLLWDWGRGRTWRDRRGLAVFASYLLVTGLYLVLRAQAQGGVRVVNEGIPPDTRALHLSLASAMITADHLLAWAWPFGRQNIFGTFAPGQLAEQALMLSCGWALVAVWLGAALALRKKNRAISLGLLWFLAAFLPLSNLVPLRNGPYADYYLVLPSLGLALALAAGGRVLVAALRGRGRPVAALALVLLAGWRVAAAAAAFDWAAAWNSEAELFRRTLRVRPYAFTAKALLARCLMKDGRLEDAERLARQARDEAPWHGQAWFVLGDTCLRAGRHQEALEIFRKAGAVRPDRSYPDTAMAFIYEEFLRDPETAEKHYRMALQKTWDQTSVTAAANLALLLARKGDLQEAVEIMEEAVLKAPRSPELLNNLSVAYRQMGRADKAEAYQDAYRRVVGAAAPTPATSP